MTPVRHARSQRVAGWASAAPAAEAASVANANALNQERRRESEERRINLESDMRDREAYVGRLTQQVHASMEELKAAQASSQQLQQELTACKEILAKVSEIASGIGNYDSQLKSIASEVTSKGSQLEKLAHSFKEVSTALKAVAKTSAIS